MIPKLHYISQGRTPDMHLEHIRQACKNGVPLVQLRLKNTEETTLLSTAEKARSITSDFGVKLIINDDYKIAKTVKADGVHLGKSDTCPRIARAFLGADYIIGGTANTLEDCLSLISKQVNYIGMGPFRFTTTKDNLSPILGKEGYESVIKQLDPKIPVIAIGGITTNDMPDLLNTGIHGVAISGTITSNFNTISIFNAYLSPTKPIEEAFEKNL